MQPRTDEQLKNIARGGYILIDSDGEPDLIIIATGSEVELAVRSAADLSAKGRRVRVVSMPCTSVFDAQDAAYREHVLPRHITQRMAVEAGSVNGWYKYVGLEGRIIGMTTYGESATPEDLARIFGFTVENVVKVAEEMLS